MGFIVNGYIRELIATGGGYDDNGDPVPVGEDWGDPIPCHVDTNNHRNDGRYRDGEFSPSSYHVFIEMPSIDYQFTAKRIWINKEGRDVGDFQVQDVQEKPKNGRIQIMV